jgi:hypothetical protein
MRISCFLTFCAFLPFTSSVNAQQAAALSPPVQKYVRVNASKVVLEHVRVIDGTGRPAVEDQNVVIERGRITALLAGSDTPVADGINLFLTTADFGPMPAATKKEPKPERKPIPGTFRVLIYGR